MKMSCPCKAESLSALQGQDIPMAQTFLRSSSLGTKPSHLPRHRMGVYLFVSTL